MAPRLLLAAAGMSRSWRGSEIVASRDGGVSYASLATIGAPATAGTVIVAPSPGQTDRWDRISAIDVELLSDDMTLESATEASVLAGANLVLAGSEVLQFATTTPIGARRFRLTTLLRGRRGTEAATGQHAAGERFVVLDINRLANVDLPIDTFNAPLIVKALGPGDDIASVPPQLIMPAGMALRPLSPATLSLRRQDDGGWLVTWTRRSRAGFGWIDGIDAPLGEDSEHYRLTLSLDGIIVRVTDVTEARWMYNGTAFTADGGTRASILVVAVAQVSATVGPGTAALTTIDLTAIPGRIFHG